MTDFILSREQASRESGERIGHVQARPDRMEAEVILRAREVKEANRQIKTVVEELERRKGELARLMNSSRIWIGPRQPSSRISTTSSAHR